jgi:hypothetical protein
VDLHVWNSSTPPHAARNTRGLFFNWKGGKEQRPACMSERGNGRANNRADRARPRGQRYPCCATAEACCSYSAVGLVYDHLKATRRPPAADCRAKSAPREGRETFPECRTVGSGSRPRGDGRLEARLPLANRMTCRLALSAPARSARPGLVPTGMRPVSVCSKRCWWPYLPGRKRPDRHCVALKTDFAVARP